MKAMIKKMVKTMIQIKMHSVLIFLSLVSLSFTLSFSVSAADLSAEKKPNVVMVVFDDLGYGDIEGFAFNRGNTNPLNNSQNYAKTPRLNKLAQQGVKMSHFLVTAPYCAPSRSSIFTGRYPFRTGLVYNPAPDQGIDGGMPSSEITIAEVLKENGYDTYGIGKWHLGHKPGFLPTQQGFDQYYGILYSNDMRPVQLVENKSVVEYPVEQATLTEKYTKKAISYIEQSVADDKPFFLYLGHAMPHKPLAASPKFHTPETPDDIYQDVIRELDYNVGILLDTLEKLKISDNTLVIVMSDNGATYGGDNGGLRGKKAVSFDGGLRVPFIARYPGKIPAGITNSSMASSINLMPTIAKLTGSKLPTDRKIDGKDMWSQLTSAKAGSTHDYFISMKSKYIKTVHAGKWKLHARPPTFFAPPSENAWQHRALRDPDGKTILAPFKQPGAEAFPGLKTGDISTAMMLFNVEQDPGEQQDISQRYPEVMAQLQQYYQHMSKQVPDNINIPKATPYEYHKGGQIDYWNIKK